MRLMQFPQALETVLQTLERMRDETGHRPCASRVALDALKHISSSRKIDILEGHAPSKMEKTEKLAAVQIRVSACVKCPNLASSRTQTVFGVGNPDAEIMFVGEAPGADEDKQGEPFVGRAGQLLTKIIKAMGFPREEVYIANVLKCRPDVPGSKFGNRPPTPKEMQTCRPYLM